MPSPYPPRRSGLRTAAIGIAAMSAVAAFGIAGPAQAAEGTILGANAPGTIPNRYIVTLKDQATAVSTSASDLTRRYGGTIRFTYEHALRGFSVNLSERQARRLAADPRVDYVEQVGMAHVAGTQTNPPSWGVDRIDQRDLPLDDSYTYPDNSSGVTVYILDTGARMSHNDFSGRITAGPDFIDGDSNPSDCNGHGTHVAGTAAGTTFGVAKHARIVPVRVLDCQGSGPWDTIVEAIDWVTDNANQPAVANMSLGGSGSQTSVENAVRNSIQAGVTYALAAGNNDSDACGFTPARVSEAITVGNSTRNDERYVGVGSSNYGRCLDIWAPGASIVSASYSSDSGSATMTGTSMASPHVAGAAALYLGSNPNASPQQVRDALVDNASSGKLTGIGSGSPNLLLYTGFIGGGDPGSPSVTNPGNQTTMVNTAVSLQIQATGGTTPYSWSATGLPAGLSIDKSTGRITGTPTSTGTSNSTVTVTDAAGKTAGTSFTWTVTDTAPGGCTGDNPDNVTISDFTVSESRISISGCSGTPSTTSSVDVHIVHTYIGDLTVDLIAPDGSSYNLHNRSGSGTDDINRTFTVNLAGESPNGTWTLRVEDFGPADVGHIDSWSLDLGGGGGPGPGDCAGYETTDTGSLTSGQNAYTDYFYVAAGQHEACLDAPDGTDFDLYLQRWTGSGWSTVESSTSPGADEALTHDGTTGYYRYRIHAYSGSGSYTLGYNAP